jgi:hypothetical protein
MSQRDDKPPGCGLSRRRLIITGAALLLVPADGARGADDFDSADAADFTAALGLAVDQAQRCRRALGLCGGAYAADADAWRLLRLLEGQGRLMFVRHASPEYQSYHPKEGPPCVRFPQEPPDDGGRQAQALVSRIGDALLGRRGPLSLSLPRGTEAEKWAFIGRLHARRQWVAWIFSTVFFEGVDGLRTILAACEEYPQKMPPPSWRGRGRGIV